MNQPAMPGYLHAMSIPTPFSVHRALIQRRFSFHEERARRILAALEEGALTGYQIASVFFPNLDPINTFLAISEVIGHLQWLETEGKVSQRRRLGVARWRVIE